MTITATQPKETLLAKWIPLAALTLAFFVEMVDNTIMTIALPSIARDLAASTTQLQWVTGAYSLVFGALLLTAGSMADRFGRRRILVVGLAGFGLVSAMVWFVTTPVELVGLRALLGVAAAFMAPVTMSLAFRLYEDPVVRMKAINVMIVAGMSAMALGPIAAGLALEHVSWHWLLSINVPVALLAAAGVLWGVTRDFPEDLHRAPLDIPAVISSMGAIGLACNTMTSGVDFGWTSPVTIGVALGAIACAVFFVRHERVTAKPMIDLSILKSRTVRGAGLAQTGSSIAMMAVSLLLMMHLQFALGWSPLQAGLGNLPLLLTMLAATPLSESLVVKYGHRITCIIAAALLFFGLAALAMATPHGYWAMVPGIVIMTAGLRIIMTVCAIALIESVPEDRTSLATALNDVVQEVGGSFGIALVGTLIAVLVTATLPSGEWPAALQTSFFHGEQITYAVLAILVGAVVGYGASTLTDSHATEEH